MLEAQELQPAEAEAEAEAGHAWAARAEQGQRQDESLLVLSPTLEGWEEC